MADNFSNNLGIKIKLTSLDLYVFGFSECQGVSLYNCKFMGAWKFLIHLKVPRLIILPGCHLGERLDQVEFIKR